MSRFATLAKKAKKAVTEEGITGLVSRTKGYLERAKRENEFQKEKSRIYRDLLFISGCNEQLPHPHRYRVLHQMEQLEAAGYTCDTVYFQEISLPMVRCYSGFIIFRAPATEKLMEFLQEAHRLNKKIWYDVDDLVIDTNYTDQIPWLSTMKPEERSAYDENVRQMGRMLSACDGAITTTARLAEELSNYVPEVLINRNCASEEMLSISEEALKKKREHQKENTVGERIVLGYFSGSATHLDDIRMILPVLTRLMEERENVDLLLVGILDLPKELLPFGKRIKTEGFVDYRRLPELIASVDINLAPLVDTVFNAAKSENKWVEAALVQTVTVASRVGAFCEMIREGEDGVLCGDEEEWTEKLIDLIEHPKERNRIAKAAYERCRRECVTIYQCRRLAEWIQNQMNPRGAFLLPALTISGGIRVALKHAEMLRHAGVQITLFVLEGKEEWYEDGEYHYPVLTADPDKIQGTLDFVTATMWNTLDVAEKLKVSRKCFYLVQNYEVDFYPPGSPYRRMASATYVPKRGIVHLTISRWCRWWLANEYGTSADYLPNGIDPESYAPHKRNLTGKVRILVEGDCKAEHKNVDESFEIIQQLPEERFEVWYMSYNGVPKDWYRVDRFLHKVPYEETPGVYEACDILLKTSLLESFSYPPLEMMASGGYVVAVPNEGNLEYLREGENALLYPPGETNQAVESILRLCQDPAMQERLYQGGLSTAKSRSWDAIRPEILKTYLE
ncbi:MAG: glycosyltransferase [Fusicatenibacter sp.]|nr:glycosyltransferase [Fusicatenibacter sp.]